MAKNLLDQIVDKLRNLGTSVKLPVVTTMAAFFVLRFYQLTTCGQGLLACGSMKEFGFVFPLYLLVMPFVNSMSSALFVVLYFLSAALYCAIAYFALDGLVRSLGKLEDKPLFRLRKI